MENNARDFLLEQEAARANERRACLKLLKGCIYLVGGVSLTMLPFFYLSNQNLSPLIQAPCKNFFEQQIYEGQAEVTFTTYPSWDEAITTRYLCDFAHNITTKSICCVYEGGEMIPSYLAGFSTTIRDNFYECLPFFGSWSIFSGFSNV